MAHTKAIGSTKLGRDSIAKRLGVKINDGQRAMVGQIIIRQRGTKYLPGDNVIRADDDTLYAGKNGVVKFNAKTKTKFDGSRRYATMVSVVS
jgi:large subunit ribosomal protein L27